MPSIQLCHIWLNLSRLYSPYTIQILFFFCLLLHRYESWTSSIESHARPCHHTASLCFTDDVVHFTSWAEMDLFCFSSQRMACFNFDCMFWAHIINFQMQMSPFETNLTGFNLGLNNKGVALTCPSYSFWINCVWDRGFCYIQKLEFLNPSSHLEVNTLKLSQGFLVLIIKLSEQQN